MFAKNLKRVSTLALCLIISPNVFGIDFVKGQIEKQGDQFYIKNSQERIKIITEKKILKYIPSLFAPSYVTQANEQAYAFEFKGERTEEGFKLFEVPTNIPGSKAISGVLKYNEESKEYTINGSVVSFGYTKVLNGYEFDDISKKSFIGKNIVAEGDLDENGVLIMQALTPVNLFDSDQAKEIPSQLEAKFKKLGAKKVCA